MSRRSCSPAPESSSKKRRVDVNSSPVFEELNLTQDDMDALEYIEAGISQKASSSSQRGSDLMYNDTAMQEMSSDDPFFEKTLSSFASASMFQTASNLHMPEPVDSSHSQPEPDYNAWFDSREPAGEISFEQATSLAVGFSIASKKGAMPISAAALAKAEAKMKEWQTEEGENTVPASQEPLEPAPGLSLYQLASSTVGQVSPTRPALRNLDNALDTPESPSIAAFSRPSTASLPPSQPFAPPSSRAKPFKPPSLTSKPSHLKAVAAVIPASKGPPSSPSSTSSFSPASSPHTSSLRQTLAMSTPARSKHPLAASPITPSPFPTPPRTLTPSLLYSRSTATPLRSTPAKFRTPFKRGMEPGTPGNDKLRLQSQKVTLSSPSIRAASTSGVLTQTTKNTQRRRFFDLTKAPNRITLSTSGLKPHWHELKDGELPKSIQDTLEQMHPSLAPYYSFFRIDSISSNIPSEGERIGPNEALEHLKQDGCSLVTKKWVDNHWSLILWKLAGMACLEPEREWYDDKKRWCWEEVHRQLLYRYEREINCGTRPPLRSIATQDVPSVYPMVLCILEVNWLEQTQLPNGRLGEAVAELQITDGWYKIRAQIDAPLTRAVTKRTLRVGRKIAVVNAKLDSERKDPQEILEAGTSIKLILNGNATHLAPWHANLGFQKIFPVATMNSLTRDGGIVPAMEVIVLKVHGIGYLESMQTNGKKVFNGPFDEKEELALRDQWQRKRELEYAKAREVIDKEFRRYTSYADRLEMRVGSLFRANDVGPPDVIDDLYDRLEELDEAASVLAKATATEAGWLALHIRAQMEKRKETMAEEIEKDLNDLCPPRNVISLRVLDIKDAHTERHPANREAALTVWDVLNVCLTEGREPGAFEVGDCCRITHVEPTSLSSWMDRSPGSQIILRTTKYTHITKLKT